MKTALKILLFSIVCLGILYVIFGIYNASFDFTVWDKDARTGYAVVGGFIELVILNRLT
jgi:hypothetical protein